ncbi:MAG: hypothetical protein LBC98_05625, partial [Prevotellaceae bacterium]|nr:hypothetical protein [Prevotellaceae bacterium]
MRYLKLIIIIVCMTSGFVVANAQNKEIVSYIDFLQNQKTHPVDYVFELFEKYDIVILGERDHRDISQYELIS